MKPTDIKPLLDKVRAGIPESDRYARGFRDGIESFLMALAGNQMNWDSSVLETVLDAFGNNSNEPTSVDQLRHERDLLAESILSAATKAGICRENAALDGPHLLMLCDDLATMASRTHATNPTGPEVVVNLGALSMALNALDRDAAEGKVVRGEIAQEVRATVKEYKGGSDGEPG